MLTLYKRIKERRKALGISQQELADMTGYTDRSSIAKIEKGEVDLTQSRIVAFANALHTTPSYLMGWSECSEDQVFLDNVKAALQEEDGKTAEIIELVLDLPESKRREALNYIRYLSENADKQAGDPC